MGQVYAGRGGLRARIWQNIRGVPNGILAERERDQLSSPRRFSQNVDIVCA